MFMAADHINAVISKKGVACIDNSLVKPDLYLDSLLLANLNFKVGLKAINQATFLSGLKYLQNGIASTIIGRRITNDCSFCKALNTPSDCSR